MNEQWTAIEGVPVALPDIAALDRCSLEAMLAAADEVVECRRVLSKGGANVISEMLRGVETFYEYDHYPDGDVYDEEFHSQYYYHAHRGLPDEHGHFHTFVRGGGVPDGIAPMPQQGQVEWPAGEDVVCHVAAISMDAFGDPVGLFATNRWVTEETWFRGEDVEGLLDGFRIDHAVPSWPTNRWVTAMMRLFRPQIASLLLHRDEVVTRWAAAHPGVDVFEDRTLEMTGWLHISVDGQMARIRDALGQH